MKVTNVGIGHKIYSFHHYPNFELLLNEAVAKLCTQDCITDKTHSYCCFYYHQIFHSLLLPSVLKHWCYSSGTNLVPNMDKCFQDGVLFPVVFQGIIYILFYILPHFSFLLLIFLRKDIDL